MRPYSKQRLQWRHKPNDDTVSVDYLAVWMAGASQNSSPRQRQHHIYREHGPNDNLINIFCKKVADPDPRPVRFCLFGSPGSESGSLIIKARIHNEKVSLEGAHCGAAKFYSKALTFLTFW